MKKSFVAAAVVFLLLVASTMLCRRDAEALSEEQEDVKVSTPKDINLTRGLDTLSAVLRGERDVDPEKLTEYEEELRQTLRSGGAPRAWSDLAPKLTSEEAKKLSTTDLAAACFKSSIFARRRLASSQPNPVYTLIDLKVFYPAYGEYFAREDAWKGWLAAYSAYASAITTKSDTNVLIDAQMGVQTLVALFFHPDLRAQLKGREMLFIDAQLQVLRKIRSYLTEWEQTPSKDSSSFFSIRLPGSLVTSSLALMRQSSPEASREAIKKITQLRLPAQYTTEDIRGYLDAAIESIGEYCEAQRQAANGHSVVLDAEPGSRITVQGWAVDQKLGAVLIGDGFSLWINGLEHWPEGYYSGGDKGKAVKVTGVLTEAYDLPVFIPKEGQPQRSGIPVPDGTDLKKASHRYLLKDAQWELMGE